MVPAGSTLIYLVTGTVSTWSPVESDRAHVESQVTNALMPYMTVKEVTVTPTTWALGGLAEYDFQARVIIATKEAHAEPTDLNGYLADAFYRATGTTPRVVLANDPYAPEPVDPNAGSPLAWLKSLGLGVQSSVTAVAIAAIVLGAAIIYSKR